MKEIFLVTLIIFNIYLYFTIDQHSKDQLKSAVVGIPSKIESVIGKVNL